MALSGIRAGQRSSRESAVPPIAGAVPTVRAPGDATPIARRRQRKYFTRGAFRKKSRLNARNSGPARKTLPPVT
jgi:hypothetical protein